MTANGPTEFRITNKTISYDYGTYQLRNITHLATYRFVKKAPFSTGSLVVMAIVALIGFANAPNGIAVICGLGASAFVAFGIKRNLKNREFFGIRLETSSGRSELFAHPDKGFIEGLIEKIKEAMEATSPYQQIVMLDQRTIFENIADSTVINRSFNQG